MAAPNIRMKTISSLALVGLSALAGCGALDSDPAQKAPLATVVGQLSNPQSVASSGPVRIAVLWRGEAMGRYNTAVDLPVQPVFPAKFQIDLRDAPPSDMLWDPFGVSNDRGDATEPGNPGTPAEPAPEPAQPAPRSLGLLNGPSASGARVAIGAVVAYEDLNNNGRLDLVDQSASVFLDRVLGANEDIMLIYFDGAVPNVSEIRDGAGKLPSLGYNLYRVGKSCATIDIYPPPPAGACTPEPSAWLPMSTLYELNLANDPRFGRLMCRNGNDSVSSASNGINMLPGRPAAYPAKTDPKLRCQAGGSFYTYGDPVCTTISEGPCKGTVTTCTPTEGRERPSPVPADWPCDSN
jgi:hypothetical protein